MQITLNKKAHREETEAVLATHNAHVLLILGIDGNRCAAHITLEQAKQLVLDLTKRLAEELSCTA